jgi:hypothetical protein
MAEFKIQKDVDIPRTAPNGSATPWKDLAAQMQVGDSVGGLTASQRSLLAQAIKKAYAPPFQILGKYSNGTDRTNEWKRGGYYVTRKMPDGKFRVWRAE